MITDRMSISDVPRLENSEFDAACLRNDDHEPKQDHGLQERRIPIGENHRSLVIVKSLGVATEQSNE